MNHGRNSLCNSRGAKSHDHKSDDNHTEMSSTIINGGHSTCAHHPVPAMTMMTGGNSVTNVSASRTWPLTLCSTLDKIVTPSFRRSSRTHRNRSCGSAI